MTGSVLTLDAFLGWAWREEQTFSFVSGQVMNGSRIFIRLGMAGRVDLGEE